jgi:hypothetical protein
MLCWNDCSDKYTKELVLGVFEERESKFKVIGSKLGYKYAKEIEEESENDKLKSELKRLEDEIKVIKSKLGQQSSDIRSFSDEQIKKDLCKYYQYLRMRSTVPRLIPKSFKSMFGYDVFLKNRGEYRIEGKRFTNI